MTRTTNAGPEDPSRPVDIPISAKDELTDVTIYETGFKTAGATVTAILKRLATEDRDFSCSLIVDALDRICNNIAVKQHLNANSSLINILKILISLEDSCAVDRLTALFTGGRGLATMILEAVAGPVQQQQQEYLSPSHTLDSYLELGRQFYSIYSVFKWVETAAEQNELMSILRSKVNPLGRVIPSPEAVESIRYVKVTISEAPVGRLYLNGEYSFYRQGPNGSAFHRRIEIAGSMCRYVSRLLLH